MCLYNFVIFPRNARWSDCVPNFNDRVHGSNTFCIRFILLATEGHNVICLLLHKAGEIVANINIKVSITTVDSESVEIR